MVGNTSTCFGHIRTKYDSETGKMSKKSENLSPRKTHSIRKPAISKTVTSKCSFHVVK